MWRLEHYQYFPFALLAVAAMAYSRIDREQPIRGPQSLSMWIVLLFAAMMVFSSLAMSSTWLGAVAFVFIGIAFFGSQAGSAERTLIGLSVPLLMILRMPVGLDQMLVIRLQGVTTRLASVLLDVIGVTHAVQGNVIQLAGRELFVAEACSGIQSVFTLAFLAAVIIAYFRRRLWLTPVYLLIAVILAIAGNVVRVTTVAVAEYFWGIDLASGVGHDVVGYISLAIAGLMLLSFDQLVITVLHPAAMLGNDMSSNPILRVWDYFVSDPDSRIDYSRGVYSRDTVEPMRSSGRESWLSSKKLDPILGNRVVWASMLGLSAILVVGASMRASNASIETPMASLLKENVIFKPDAKLLDGEIGALEFYEHLETRGGSNPRLGQNSDVWTCRFGENLAQFVVSQTYSGWHELCVCYEGMEWQLVERDVLAPDDTSIDRSTPTELLADVDTNSTSNSNEAIQGDVTTETDTIDVLETMNDTTPDDLSPEDLSYVSAKFKRQDGNYGYLIFGAVYEDGTICPAPSNLGAYGSRFLSRLDLYGVVDQQDLVMVQLWYVSVGKLDNKKLKELRRGFELARQNVAAAMSKQAPLPQASIDPTKPSSFASAATITAHELTE
ncbi:Transmembrane exosortase [Planctomycetes bacterium CA13]|uniref:Transmembrane exosortase n=2 Tax=Novipirellula herctigrandis TaxID=2527986 RepID=A0A5C5ZCH3_9BACT|nr:Transmembrane exosortase [Planctomycetes bacterium CA13]